MVNDKVCSRAQNICFGSSFVPVGTLDGRRFESAPVLDKQPLIGLIEEFIMYQLLV